MGAENFIVMSGWSPRIVLSSLGPLSIQGKSAVAVTCRSEMEKAAATPLNHFRSVPSVAAMKVESADPSPATKRAVYPNSTANEKSLPLGSSNCSSGVHRQRASKLPIVSDSVCLYPESRPAISSWEFSKRQVIFENVKLRRGPCEPLRTV